MELPKYYVVGGRRVYVSNLSEKEKQKLEQKTGIFFGAKKEKKQDVPCNGPNDNNNNLCDNVSKED